MNVIINQAKATYGPVGATPQRERPASPRSPPESRSVVRGHVCAAPTGWQKKNKKEKNAPTIFHGLSVKTIKTFCRHMGLQELQRENVFLRAQFAECTDCAAQEKAEAERRLGAVEAETRRLTESLKETCERHAEEMKKQEERVGPCSTHFPPQLCRKPADEWILTSPAHL